jgi:tripeptidyl-peptidase-1
MHFSTLVLFSGLAASVLAVPATRHSVHESRFIVPPGWERQGRLEHDLVLPVRVGLTQSNLDNAEDLLADVSDPESTNYGNHWSDERIANFFAPSQHTVSAVRSWLNSSGISSHRISQSAGRGWLDFKATVAEVEQLLKTEYWRYEHDTGMAHLSCHEYSVPEHITKHIDFITPTLHFDAQVPRKLSDHVKRAKIPPKIAPGSGGVSSGTVIKAGGISGGPVIGKSVTPPVNRPGSGFVGGSACGQYVTPACLRALYNIPHGTKNLTSLGIVEYFPQTFLQSDMNNFQRISVTNDVGMPVGTSPLIQNIDGGSVLPLSEMDGSYWAESNLDLVSFLLRIIWLFYDEITINNKYSNMLWVLSGHSR